MISYTDMKTKHENIMSFCTRSVSKVSESCYKSPLQIHVGSVSRRYELGAERIFLSSSYIPTIKVNVIPRNHLIGVPIIVLSTKVWFGNICVRSIFNLCSYIIEIKMKVKSGVSIDALSPTLSILGGCSRKIVIYLSNYMSLFKEAGGTNCHRVLCMCSLTHLSHVPQHQKYRLVSSLISLVCANYNRKLDYV